MSYKSDYSEKLRDPRWQKMRLVILDRDHFTCQKCYDGGRTLHVHHLQYFKDKDPWDIHPQYLITLCEDCHDYETENYSAMCHDFMLIMKSKQMLTDDFKRLIIAFENFDPHEVPAMMNLIYFCNDDELQRLAYEKRCPIIEYKDEDIPEIFK